MGFWEAPGHTQAFLGMLLILTGRKPCNCLKFYLQIRQWLLPFLSLLFPGGM